MAVVHINREHQRDESFVRQHIEELAQQLSERLSAQYHWENENRLAFKRRGAKGYLEQKKGELEVHLELNAFLSPLKGSAERIINDYLDRTLA
ncbi:poly(3-hydroxybutyrate) depolymerase [Proteobacteria bacterium 005FR1]|nr:poly(3-hydroxybutyrate) depolymerase [Proteobacteria bacterium 005FR1]